LTTQNSRKNPFFLNIALDDNNFAKGDLFIDDGESLDSIPNKNFYVEYISSNNKLTSKIVSNNYDVSNLRLSEISIYGAPKTCRVTLNGRTFSSFSYSDTSKVLNIHSFSIPMSTNFEFGWSC
jgi:hypothetical protein